MTTAIWHDDSHSLLGFPHLPFRWPSISSSPFRPPASPSTPAPLRLSLDHGASAEDVASHVAGLRRELSQRISGGLDASTSEEQNRPMTASVGDVYRLGREIGRGHIGVVRVCQEKTSGKTLACKSISKDSIRKQEDLEEVCGEIMSMLLLHRHVAALQRSQHSTRTWGRNKETPPFPRSFFTHLHEVLEDQYSVHLIVDYCAGGDLFSHVAGRRRLGEREAAQIVRQLAEALQHMHSLGLVHRDLKPENILLTRQQSYTPLATLTGVGVGAGMSLWGASPSTSPPAPPFLASPRGLGDTPEVRLADFGLCARVHPGTPARGVVGSPFYMAPEVVKGHLYGSEVDTWSLGVILYTCLSGHLPFNGRTCEEVFAKVVLGRPDLTRRGLASVSLEAKHLICCLLEPRPRDRISLEGVLVHPWVLRHSGDDTPSSCTRVPLARTLRGSPSEGAWGSAEETDEEWSHSMDEEIPAKCLAVDIAEQDRGRE